MTIRVDASVSFTYPTFDANEGNGLAQLVLTLTNPSSSVVNIQVLDTDGSATSKPVLYIYTMCNMNGRT